MLRSIKQLYGATLGASDGNIGQVKDFYFDDQNWAIRYLVADTGLWLPGRQVLLSPHSLGGLEQAGKLVRVNLTRKQIENSPSIELHKPVSRHYEEEYHRYYGWPFYWQGDALLGLSGVPLMEAPANPLASEATAAPGPPSDAGDAHLRSTQAVHGYHLQATDGQTGHVCDFMINPETWTIDHLVIKTGHRLSDNEVLVPTTQVERISYQDSTVFVHLTAEAVQLSPARHLPPV